MARVAGIHTRIASDLEQYLREASVLAACRAAGHVWRERQLGPVRTLARLGVGVGASSCEGGPRSKRSRRRRACEESCWTFDRQRARHMVLVKAAVAVNLSVPDHRELDHALLRGLIRDAGMTVDE